MEFIKKLFGGGDVKSVAGKLSSPGGIISMLAGGALGYYTGGSMGALIGLLGGSLLGGIVDGLISNLSGTVARPPALPSDNLKPEQTIQLNPHKVNQPENKPAQTVQIAEVTLEKLKVPPQDIKELTKKRQKSEATFLKIVRGEASRSETQGYEQQKKDLKEADKLLGQYLINFHAFDKTKAESKELKEAREKLVLVLKNSGMSEDQIKNDIPDVPALPDNVKIPVLTEQEYNTGLEIFAQNKGVSTTAQVKDSWDTLGSFGQLNYLRQLYAEEADNYRNDIKTNKSVMFGNRALNDNYHGFFGTGVRQTAQDVRDETETGDFTAAAILGRYGDNYCKAQSKCAVTVEKLLLQDPYAKSPLKGDQITLPAELVPQHTKVTKSYGLKSGNKTNIEYLAQVAASGLLYAQYHKDEEAEAVYKKALLYCQSCNKHKGLDGIADTMNASLENLNRWRDEQLKPTNDKITKFQKDLPKLNEVITARTKAGFSIVRKAVDKGEAVIVIEDFSNPDKKAYISLLGNINSSGKFVAKKFLEGKPPIMDSDHEQLQASKSMAWKNLSNELTLDTNELVDISALKNLVKVATTSPVVKISQSQEHSIAVSTVPNGELLTSPSTPAKPPVVDLNAERAARGSGMA